jgi:hypothetical protein
MGVSGQLHILASLLLAKSLWYPLNRRLCGVLDLVSMFWVREKSLAFARNWTVFLRHPVHSLVIIITLNMQNLKVQQFSIDFTTAEIPGV